MRGNKTHDPRAAKKISVVGLCYGLELAASQGAEAIVHHVIAYAEMARHDEGFYSESLAKLVPQQRRELLAEFLKDNFAETISKIGIRQVVEVGIR